MKNTFYTTWLFALIAMFIALPGCGSNRQGGAGGEPLDVGGLRDVDVATLEPGIGPGNIALEITGVDSAGKEFSLSDYRGKVVMLNFWADW